MLTIGKIGVLVSMCLLCLFPLNAEPGDYGFSLSPLAGFLYGRGEEIVYDNDGRPQYLSQLLWDLKPLFYLGLAAGFDLTDPFEKSGFGGAASLKIGLPLKSGIQENRDWLHSQYDYLTHYAREDAYSGGAVLAEISAGYSWRLTERLALAARAELSFTRFSWTARDGYAQYPPQHPNGGYPKDDYPLWSENQPEPINGTAVRYSQNWIILAPGLVLKGRISRFFSLEGNFYYSPLIYCAARDDHLDTSTGKIAATYWDFLLFGHYIKAGGMFTFSPDKSFDVSLSLAYRHIAGSRGNSWSDKSGWGNFDWAQKNGQAGAGHSSVDVCLAVTIELFDNQR